MISQILTRDARYPIGSGHGSDAIHKDPIYSYAVTLLQDDKGRTGSGLAFTLGEGNQLVCEAAKFYAERLAGMDIEDIMVGESLAITYQSAGGDGALSLYTAVRWFNGEKLEPIVCLNKHIITKADVDQYMPA